MIIFILNRSIERLNLLKEQMIKISKCDYLKYESFDENYDYDLLDLLSINSINIFYFIFVTQY